MDFPMMKSLGNLSRLDGHARVICFAPSTGTTYTVVFIGVHTDHVFNLNLPGSFAMVGNIPCPMGNHRSSNAYQLENYLFSIRVPDVRFIDQAQSSQVPVTLWFPDYAGDRFDSIQAGTFTYIDLQTRSTTDDNAIQSTESVQPGAPLWISKPDVTWEFLNFNIGDLTVSDQMPGENGSASAGLPSETNENEPICLERSLTPTTTQTSTPQSTPEASGPRMMRWSRSYTACSNITALNFHQDPMSLAANWSIEELTAKRRVVEFTRCQEKDILFIQCQVAREAHCPPAKLHVSCILWERLETLFITSADVFRLIEFLTASRSTDEEKKKIRRVLEVYRPLTARREGPESSDIYAAIMSFPEPKPRNTKRDIKLLPWSCLANTLERVLTGCVGH